MRIIYCILLTVFFSSCKGVVEVDMIIQNAVIYTVNNQFSTAQSMAIKDGKIIAIGTDQEILSKYTAKETINANRQFIYPGFVDAHAHFVGYGQSLFMVNLYGAGSWEEVVERVKEFSVQHPGEQWIIGRGWDQNKWKDKNFPNNQLLNDLFPGKPVVLTRIDGHAAIVNNSALNLAGIVAGQNIKGGEIEVKDGNLTGILIDNAVDLVSSKMSHYDVEDYLKWLTIAEKNCFAVGLTTVADCGLMYNDVSTIDGLQKEEKIHMRLYVLLSDDTANYVRYLNKSPYKTDKLYVKGFKLYADGALGSRGACLLHPYADKANWTGFLLKDKKYFDSISSVIYSTDYQVCTHAIGDSANRVILEMYNRILKGKNDRRWRIEHAQVVNESDFYMFEKASVVPSVQPTHATSDMYWAEQRLGTERIKNAYAYRQLLEQNGWIALGTDFPVEDISPLKTFYAAVYRKDSNGYPNNGFQTENALTRIEALKGITIWAAKSMFLDNEIGSLEVGKKADFIITDQDLLVAPDNKLLDTKVQHTYLGGKRVY